MRHPYVLCVLMLPLLAACGERVVIQPGEVGRQLTTSGLETKNRKPGAFRMESCIVSACPRLVRLQTQKATKDFTIDKLFLPKSNVDMTNVKIGIQFRVKRDKQSLNQIFNEVRPERKANRVLVITTDMVYATYIQRKAPDAIITALREYEVDQVLSEVPEIASYAKKKINEMLKSTPVEVTELGFPNGIGEPPPEVLQAKRRLYAVNEQKARDIKALQAALTVEDHRQAVQRKRTLNDMENARKAGVGFATYVFLKNMERFADEKVPLGYMPYSPVFSQSPKKKSNSKGKKP